MALASKNITVTTTATALNPLSEDTADGGLLQGNSVLITNTSSVTVYIGGSDVTADAAASTGGKPLAAGAELPATVGPGEVIYGRVASGSQVVNVLRQGV